MFRRETVSSFADPWAENHGAYGDSDNRPRAEQIAGCLTFLGIQSTVLVSIEMAQEALSTQSYHRSGRRRVATAFRCRVPSSQFRDTLPKHLLFVGIDDAVAIEIDILNELARGGRGLCAAPGQLSNRGQSSEPFVRFKPSVAVLIISSDPRFPLLRRPFRLSLSFVALSNKLANRFSLLTAQFAVAIGVEASQQALHIHRF